MSAFLTDKPVATLFRFLQERIGLVWSDDFQALGRVVDGKLIGVFGFNGFNGASCQMHMAGDQGWMTRGMIETAARFCFLSCDLKMIVALVPSGNTTALEIDRRLGFTTLDVIEGAHPDGALHLLQLTKANCRWIERKRYGQEEHSRTA